MLVHRFNLCSDADKHCFFRSFFSSSYGGPLWYLYKNDTYRKCVVAFNNIYCKLAKIQKGESISTNVNMWTQCNFMAIGICI